MGEYLRMTRQGGMCKSSVYSLDFQEYVCGDDIVEKHNSGLVQQLIERLADFEDKLDNGTLVKLPKKCYRVVYIFGWEIVEYDVVKVTFDHMEGIVSVKATRPHTIEYFTKDNSYEGRVIGVDVFFTEAEAKARLEQNKQGGKYE